MSMNLKPAIRYQLREYLVSCLVFWAINALLIGIGFLVLSLNLGSGDRSGYTYNGYGFACAIFFLVFGLILPRQAIRLCVQMGVSLWRENCCCPWPSLPLTIPNFSWSSLICLV